MNTWSRCFQRAAEAAAPRHKYDSNSETVGNPSLLMFGLGLKPRENESPEKPDFKGRKQECESRRARHAQWRSRYQPG